MRLELPENSRSLFSTIVMNRDRVPFSVFMYTQPITHSTGDVAAGMRFVRETMRIFFIMKLNE